MEPYHFTLHIRFMLIPVCSFIEKAGDMMVSIITFTAF